MTKMAETLEIPTFKFFNRVKWTLCMLAPEVLQGKTAKRILYTKQKILILSLLMKRSLSNH